MTRYTAVLDACVLVPIALADTLLRIAEKGLYRPLWSDRILTEAQEAIEEIHPGIDVTKRFADMREAFDDALVTGWEGLEAGIIVKDENDKHVVAAAIRVGPRPSSLQTSTISPMPHSPCWGCKPSTLTHFSWTSSTLARPLVVQVIREQASHTRSPALAPPDLATQLVRAGAPAFAEEILRLISAPLDGGS
jgi:hypothetical protein